MTRPEEALAIHNQSYGHSSTFVELAGGGILHAACAEFLALCPEGVAVPLIEGMKRGSAAGLTGEENQAFNVPAIHAPPARARQLIREGAREALERARSRRIEPLRIEPPYELVRLTRPDANGQRRRAVVTGTDILEVLEQRPVYEVVG